MSEYRAIARHLSGAISTWDTRCDCPLSGRVNIRHLIAITMPHNIARVVLVCIPGGKA